MDSVDGQSAVDGLLERADLLDTLAHALSEVRDGPGRLLLLGGEAGVGKTALLRQFCGDLPVRVLWGHCERLFTPRALGPFLDIADAAGGRLAACVGPAITPHGFLIELTVELRARAPTVLVIEDLHWADEGTLDVLKLLGRRVESLPVLVLGSFRDDQLNPIDDLQIVLGDLATAPGVERHHVSPLSLAAVRTLAALSGADADELFTKTAGNPFFVTEALAAGEVTIPATVRDAVLARAAQLAPAPRRLLDAAAVIPSRIEPWLLEEMAADEVSELDACLGSGMLRLEEGRIGFRHELARLAIEEAIAPTGRLALHRAALAALSQHAGPVDPARMAHHADAAEDAGAVLRYAPEAGERAAALDAHRQAAQQFARALRYAGGLEPVRRAALLERRSYECYLTNQISEATEARRAALALYQEAADPLREGDSHRWLSRLAWFAADNATAEREAERAVTLLEHEPPGRELAMAYSNAAQLRMLAHDLDGTVELGERAIALAERLDETEILVHALNNVGVAEMCRGWPIGVATVERSLTLALDAGLEEHVARAYTNLGAVAVQSHRVADADRYLSAGIEYCEEHDLDAWLSYMTGWRALWCLERGDFDRAADHTVTVLRGAAAASVSRIVPLSVLGRLRARRGDPDRWEPLDEALELAQRTAELQRLAPVAGARAEAHWLAGNAAAAAAETDRAFALARERGDVWALGQLSLWRRRAGIDDPLEAAPLPEPFATQLRGDHGAAALQWKALDQPYEAALAQCDSDQEQPLREALATFHELGAVTAARIAAARLRELGATGVRRGPRRSTTDNPRQLTSRQLEILRLVGARLTNNEIAERLYLSPRTVDHHVSAILGKLGVDSRREAAAEAVRLGLAEK